jgi:release factor glutamine methyltransferase
MHSIAQQLQNARQVLAPIAGANAGLEARLLAAHAWRMSPEELVFYGKDSRDVTAFGALIARRLRHEPVAQILGEKHFWRDVFKVSPDVLTPRADSETMIECLLRHRPDHRAALRVLDLGVGSGCLLLSTLREYPNAQGVGVDQSEAALNIAAHNAAMLGFDARCQLLHSNWCSQLEGMFDVVLSNPPYIPTADIAMLDADVNRYEPHGALDGGADGLDCYRALVQQLPTHVNAGALVLFEVGLGQADDVAAMGVAAGWILKEIANDLAGIARVVVFETKA